MDLSRLASFQSLLIVSCGDVERNPGPPKKETCKSEVLRQFMRCIQSVLVMLVYKAYQQEPPKQLYKKAPPGWDGFDKDIEFKNICNSKKEGNKTFDKLVKLCKKCTKEVKGLIPKNILDVIVCYENLRDSQKDADETKAWKLALENYVSQNKSMKNKSTVMEQMNDQLLIEFIHKGTEGVKQGIIGSSPESIRDIFSALNGLISAAEENMEQMVPLKKPHTAGKKRSLTAEQEEAMSMIEQVKRKKKSFDCMYVQAETTEKGEPKPKRNSGSKGKHHKAMVTQKSIHPTSQQSDSFMKLVPDSSGNQVNMVTSLQIPPLIPELLLYSVPSNRPQQIEPQQFEPQQMEPQQFEPQQMEVPQQVEAQQFEPQQMEPQEFEPQQMEVPQQFEPQQMEPQQFEPQQMEQQQVEPQQFEPQQMEVPQQMEPQQVEPEKDQLPLPYSPSPPRSGIYLEDFQLPYSPSPPCSGIYLEDFQLPFSPSPTWDTNDSEDFQSESSLEDEDLKSMALQDTIGKYPY